MARKEPSKLDVSSMGPKNIVFFHPDLGIGGAERLIVDAAVGLQNLGHKVTIFTSHCDPRHCFEEARDGTLNVRVRGNTIFPPAFFNRFHILLAILRQLHLVLSIAVFGDELWSLTPDIFIVDQLSACVPLLRWIYPKKQRTLFYCHFPDQLLVQQQETGILKAVKTVYRFPFDWFEAWSTDASDRIVVNSKFTRSVAKRTFSRLTRDLDVIYPCVNMEAGLRADEAPLWSGKFKILLSINRFERKKNIGLALRAYNALTPAERTSTRLILAGGYDSRMPENVQYHEELAELAEQSGMKYQTAKTMTTALAVADEIEVLFLLSVPGPFKETLLRNAKLLIYTPTNEHFGIVPVEAMQYGVPVLAANTGGPLETIAEGETGWLRGVGNVEDWTQVMRNVLTRLTPSQQQEMGEKGKQRVNQLFTRSIMAKTFEENIGSMLKEPRPKFLERNDIMMGLGLVGVFAAALISVIFNAVFSPNSEQKTTAFAHVRRKHG